jgi:penicillin-binding protein 1A
MPSTPRKRSRQPVKKRRSRFLSIILILFIMVFITGTLLSLFYGILLFQLPNIQSLKDYNPPLATQILAEDGSLIGLLFVEKRILVPLSELPFHLIQAFIASEDSRFFKHRGLDFLSILRALWKNIWAGEIIQGGSTITQQVTKSLLLTPEKSFSRKIKEALLAYRLDQNLTKQEILYIYLNQIYLGHGAYGVEAAAQTYFEKKARDLTLAESTLLAGLPQAPSRYSPLLHPGKARERQRYVLNRMAEEGFISDQQAQQTASIAIQFGKNTNPNTLLAPHLVDLVRKFLYQTWGSEVVLKSGLVVQTTLNPHFQQAALEAVRNGVGAIQKRHVYIKPLRRLAAEEIQPYCNQLARSATGPRRKKGETVQGVVVQMDLFSQKATICLGKEWLTLALGRPFPEPRPPLDNEGLPEKGPPSIGLQPGDVVRLRWDQAKSAFSLLDQSPVEAALLCIEGSSGAIRALVGGKDYSQTEFNRVVQSRRQPGSAFKPIIYAAALDKGLTPATMLMDTPIHYGGPIPWTPQNFDQKFLGPTSLRTALIQSRNIVSIRILQRIGVKYAVEYAQKLGISSPLYPNLSLALGASGISLWEMVTAYNCFPNSGQRVSPFYINQVRDRMGRVIYAYQPNTQLVIEADTAYIMTHLLEGVVKEGTGWRLRGLGKPVAGKTGTTNEFRDAWFMGFTPQYTAGVWVGIDDLTPLGQGETGAQAASPIFLEFFQKALAQAPALEFPVPQEIVFQPMKGAGKDPQSAQVVMEAFRKPRDGPALGNEIEP